MSGRAPGTGRPALDWRSAAVALALALAACGDEAPDPCTPSPCEHDGTCIDNDGAAVCLCQPGFAGATCATNLDDCAPNPCFNGGTCTDGVDTFTCACPPGAWGVQCEALIAPLAITTPALATAAVGSLYGAPLARTGGTSGAVWSVRGTNTGWLHVDAATGVLSGTPGAGDLGAVTATVRVQEPVYQANLAEKTFTFNVIQLPAPPLDSTFDTGCPAGWTLTGDWQCGVPMVVGPPAAFSGTQCLGTAIAGAYSSLQTFAAATATSPPFALSAELPAKLTFRMWVDTEGQTYDGANLSVSRDGGGTYQLLAAVMPAYPLTIGGQPAWGGHQAALGWQLVDADLTAYRGETISLRFAFQSDASGTFAGIYLDDVHVGY